MKKTSRTNYLHLANGTSDGSLTVTPAVSLPDSASSLSLHTVPQLAQLWTWPQFASSLLNS